MTQGKPGGMPTPTPWRESKDRADYILAPDGKRVAEVTIAFRSSDETAANRALIVRAVNAHERLVEALEKIAGGFCPGSMMYAAAEAPTKEEAQRRFHMAFSAWMQEVARAALKLAEETEGG